MSQIVLGPASDVPAGSMRAYKANGRRVLVAHVGDAFYALDARCPHLGGDLSRGRLEGNVVVCPLHGSRFDVRDGRVEAWIEGLPGLVKAASGVFKKPTPAHSLPVQFVDGILYLEVPD